MGMTQPTVSKHWRKRTHLSAEDDIPSCWGHTCHTPACWGHTCLPRTHLPAEDTPACRGHTCLPRTTHLAAEDTPACRGHTCLPKTHLAAEGTPACRGHTCLLRTVAHSVTATFQPPHKCTCLLTYFDSN